MVSKQDAPELKGWVEVNDSAKPFGTALLMHVWCPKCRKSHTHGIPSREAKLPSHRWAHCENYPDTGYMINWDSETKKGIDYTAWAANK
jgi:hypothetical protein